MMNDNELRQQLKNIVTRDGKSGRIPELLEDELDKLEDLIRTREQRIRGESGMVSADSSGAKFQRELSNLINKYSKESGSNTNDFILAEYLVQSLEVFDYVTRYRDDVKGSANSQQEK